MRRGFRWSAILGLSFCFLFEWVVPRHTHPQDAAPQQRRPAVGVAPLPHFAVQPSDPAVPSAPSTTTPAPKPHIDAQIPAPSAAAPISSVPAKGAEASKAPSTQRLLLSVRPDKAIYRPGERVRISGKLVNLDAVPFSSVVMLEFFRRNAQEKVEDAATYTAIIETRPSETSFMDEGYAIQVQESTSIGEAIRGQSVPFKVRASAWLQAQGASDKPAYSETSFLVEDVGYAQLLKLIGLPVLLVVVFLALCLRWFTNEPTKHSAKQAMLLVYASGLLFLLLALAGPFLISFSPGTEALVRTTPVGIAKATTEKIKDLQWIVNLGGTISGDGIVKGGYAVPLFVIIWGVIGGVISMLLKLPDFLREYDAILAVQSGEAQAASELRQRVFRYFVYILTGPFLAMMVFSLATLADYTNAMALGILGFSVGFASDSIVEAILSMTSGFLTRIKTRFASGDPGNGGSGGTSPQKPPAVTATASTPRDAPP